MILLIIYIIINKIKMWKFDKIFKIVIVSTLTLSVCIVTYKIIKISNIIIELSNEKKVSLNNWRYLQEY